MLLTSVKWKNNKYLNEIIAKRTLKIAEINTIPDSLQIVNNAMAMCSVLLCVQLQSTEHSGSTATTTEKMWRDVHMVHFIVKSQINV